jgi:O-antigen/teichoic acid export membrane protein
MAVSNVLVLAVDFGYSVKLSKDTSQNPSMICLLTVNSLVVKIVFACLIGMLLTLIYHLDAYTNQEFKIILIMSMAATFNSIANHCLIPYRSVDKFEVEALYVGINNVFIFGSVSTAAIVFRNIESVAYSFLVIKFVYSVFACFRFIKDFGIVAPCLNIYKEIREAMPYALHIAVGTIYLNIDTIILKEYITLEELGVYQAGLRMVAAATIFMSVLSSVLIPRMTKLYENKDIFYKEATRFNYISIILGIVGGLLIIILSNQLVNIAFGDAFKPLVSLLPFFSAIVCLRYMGLVYGILLTVSGMQKIRVISSIVTLIFIVVFDIVIIPDYGYLGALYVLVAAHILLNIIYIVFSYKYFKTFFLNFRRVLPCQKV